MSIHRAYDHRIKQLIANAGDPNLFQSLNIPSSTAREWIKKGSFDVVTLPEFELASEDLVIKVNRLKSEFESLKTKQKLVIFTFKIFGLQIQYKRLPKDDDKSILIYAIKSAAKSLSLDSCLDAIGLSLARYKLSTIPELVKHCSLLKFWKTEILEYFDGRFSYGRVEGFNRKAKLVQRKAYGFKSFKNYRLQLLYACRGRPSRRLPTMV